MSCISRIPGQALVALLLVALIAAAPAAVAAPAEGRTVAAAADAGGWTGFFVTPWRALHEIIRSLAGADGTEDPPPPPPPPPDDEGGDLNPPSPPSCPAGQTGGPCVDPGS
jgi:hypothetical protein